MKNLVGVALFLFFALVVSILTSGFLFYQISKQPTPLNNAPGLGQQSPTGAFLAKDIALSAEEVARHSASGDCWMLIGGKVYDVTSYLNTHPGGPSTMIPYCGKDATQAFATKGVSRSHSQDAQNLMSSFYIGDLNQHITQTSAPSPLPGNNVNFASNPASSTIPTTTVPRTTSTAQRTTTTLPSASTTTIPNSGGGTSTVPSTTTTAPAGITLSEVAAHSTASDCWMAISGKVYDVTSYIPYHPGGPSTIILYCGQDATVAFSAISHSPTAYNMLNSYYVGDLASATTTIPSTTTSVTSTTTSIPGTTTTAPTTTIPPTTTTIQSGGITLAQVALHNTASNCWLIISSKVYNITSYIPYHPGGAGTITPYCGKDATVAFSSVSHSQTAINLLNNYYIGFLYIPPTTTTTVPVTTTTTIPGTVTTTSTTPPTTAPTTTTTVPRTTTTRPPDDDD